MLACGAVAVELRDVAAGGGGVCGALNVVLSIARAIRNRLLVCALILMLAPWGISLPTFVRAAQAESAQAQTVVGRDSIEAVRFEDHPETVGNVSTEPAYGALYTGAPSASTTRSGTSAR